MTLAYSNNALTKLGDKATRKLRARAPGVKAMQAQGAANPLLKPSVNLPRPIRTRLAMMPIGVRKSSKQAAPTSPLSPNQDAAVNANGRVALGPWNGPFQRHPSAEEELPASPIYVDVQGRVHMHLTDASIDPSQQNGTDASAASAQRAVLRSPRELKRRAVGQAGGSDGPQRRTMLKGARAAKRTHMINQPRRMN